MRDAAWSTGPSKRMTYSAWRPWMIASAAGVESRTCSARAVAGAGNTTRIASGNPSARIHGQRGIRRFMALFLEGEDTVPVILHADNGPSLLHRLVVQRLGEGADLGVGQPQRGSVGVLARRIIVQYEHRKPRAVTGLGVFQHLPVAGRIRSEEHT